MDKHDDRTEPRQLTSDRARPNRNLGLNAANLQRYKFSQYGHKTADCPQEPPQANQAAHYARANLMESQGDYDSEDNEAYIPLRLNCMQVMENGTLLLLEGAQHPCRGPPETEQPPVMNRCRQFEELETPVQSVVTQEPMAVVLAQHKQAPRDSQRQEHLSQEHLQHQPQFTGTTETQMTSARLTTCRVR